jgi:L-rhamnose mutarotase
MAAMKRTGEGYNRWQEMLKEQGYNVHKDTRLDDSMGALTLALSNANMGTLERPSKADKSAWSPDAFTGGRPAQSGRRPMCFEMGSNQTDRAAFLEAHAQVWGQMERVLVECGWHKFSLFDHPDGLAIAYYESDHATHVESVNALKKTEVEARWKEVMQPLQASSTERWLYQSLADLLCCGTNCGNGLAHFCYHRGGA